VTATFVRPDLDGSSNGSWETESRRMGWAGHVARMEEKLPERRHLDVYTKMTLKCFFSK